ncbi:ricin-type beta-trefoil lectin domain protein [Micromonospora siamensis]|uniref:RHS repeat-associated core domain-containing protein n=1 Tax=Micromonospora siamensis TaxID=299152 RepID=A0A1C5HEG4_9ACTN|nr:ricin-type beta-trefoil lectin domain protein [Micromonospora siamensis]SCG44247.1 RHS repeat-associated core domain-containing protein [Micromonospora siamensis]
MDRGRSVWGSRSRIPHLSNSRGGRALAVGLSVVLVATMADQVVAQPAVAAPPVEAAPAGPQVLERPDEAAALTTARLTKKKVRITGMTSETSEFWALPDGRVEAEVHSGPVRLRDGKSGGWKPVDFSLVPQADGSWAGRAHPAGLRVSGAAGAGEHDLVSVQADGGTVSLGWSGRLPAPTVEGTRATYAEVRPGVDLVIESTRTGFEQFLVVKNRAAVAQVRSLSLPLRGKGLTVADDKRGGFEIRNKAGAAIGVSPQPQMWDAKVDPQSGEHVRRAHVGKKMAAAKAGRVAMTLTPDQAWLTDPKTVFPVTIDPAVTLKPNYDAFVQSDYTSDQSAATELKLGTYDGGTTKARSFLSFRNLGWLTGKQVQAATLYLWNHHSWSCTARQWEAWRVDYVDTTARWTAQPTWRERTGYTSTTKGYSSSCADGWVNVSVTGVFGVTATNGWTTANVGLRAASETDSLGWKRFNSMEGSYDPYVTLTYQSPPTVNARATVPSTACATGTSTPYLNTKTPQLRAQINDAEGSQVKAEFEWTTGGGTRIGGAIVGPGASGSWLATSVPAGAFAEGSTYSWHVRGNDGLVNSAWSSYCAFIIDTTAPSATPTVSSTAYPAGQWAGAANTAGSFTFGASGVTDVASYEYGLNTNPPNQTVNAATLGGAATVSITPTADGPQTLYVRSKDRAGNTSAIKTYTFNVGSGAVTAPKEGDITAAKTAITGIGQAAATGVTYQWRRGDADAWINIPAGHVTLAAGGGAVTWPLATSGGGNFPKLNWDVEATLKAADAQSIPRDGPLQLRGTFTGGTGGTSSAVKITFDRTQASAESQEIGPGSVNLITGNYTLSDTDVSVDSFGSDLTVTRSYNTRRATETDSANIFGPGWVSGAVVDEAGAPYTSLTVYGSLVQVGLPEGDTIGFAKRTATVFDPELGMEDLKLSYDGTADRYTLTDLDGNTTLFTRVTGSAAGKYAPTSVTVPGSNQTTTLSWETATVDGKEVVRPTRMLAPVPDGVNCATLTRGCRALTITYATATTATGTSESALGDYLGRVKEISFTAWDPDLATPAMRTVPMARYAYDNTGRLRATWDPRLDWTDASGLHHLSDRYTYDTTGLLKTVTPNSQPPWYLTYSVLPGDPGAGRVVSVSRGLSVTGPSGAGPMVSSVIPWTGRLCLDLASSNTTDGNKVQVYRCNGSNAQNWELRSDGTVRALGKCLNVDASGTTPGTPVNIWTCDGSARQQWALGANGSLVNPNSGACLDDPDFATADGTQVQIATCNGSIAQVWSGTVSTVVYKVPTAGTGAPYDLSGAQTTRWYQNEQPTDATAVFPPTQIPGGRPDNGTLPPSWERATVTYLDANARAVNTAQPGGHISATWYDQFGNVVRTLTAGNRARALNASATDDAATETALARALSTLNSYSADGQRLLQTQEPEHDVMLADGTTVRGRKFTSRTYDQGAPTTGAPYHLVTTEDVGVKWYPNGVETNSDIRTTTTAYDWTLRQPTAVTVDPAGLAQTTRTTYDPITGLVTSTTAPAGGTTTNTPATRQTIYYRATSGSGYAECDLKPEWANLVCRVQSGGQAASGPELPATVTTYDMFNQSRVVTEKTSAGTLRTTTTTYDGAGRAYETAVSAPGLGTAVPVTRNVYDQATGQLLRTQSVVSGSVTAQVVRAYDALGRTTSYTDADGNVSTTTYDLMGRTKTSHDGKAQRTYTYDGGTERRGLLTSVDDTEAGSFSGSYDADGGLVSESWPNGVQVSTETDETGTQVGLTYVKPGCAATDCTLYTESVTESVHGQWRDHSSTLSGQRYTYDAVGRLTSLADEIGGQCATRSYGFSVSSNRNSATEYGPASDGGCQTTTAASSRTWTYDTADRVNTAGYVYDALGRTTTVPAVDTGNPAGGNVTATYHVTDLVDTVTQNGRTTDYTLDVTGERIRSWTDNASGTAVQAVNHYDGDDDSPCWTQEDTDTFTRPLSGLTGMAGIFDGGSGEVAWHLTNLHGDLVAELDNTGEGLARTTEASEYGTPRNEGDIGTERYGWLGAKQRAADVPSGIILMGVRLYNPTTGRFLQEDPVYGGSANAYEYCAGDPVNCFDLDGKRAECGCSSDSGWRGPVKRFFRRVIDRGKELNRRFFNWQLNTIFRGISYGVRAYRAARGFIRNTRIRCLRFPNVGGFGCDLRYKGTRKFGIHYHKVHGRWRPHYHRRPGIGKHRPWEGGW